MVIEVEVKYPIQDLESIEYFLLEHQAQLLEICNQRDHYFNHPCRNFQKTDEVLRIREIGKEYYLTYKGEKLDNDSKTRKEVEVQIPTFVEMEQIITSLGFIKVLIVIKERRTYSLDNITINLDQVESLGFFIELEIIANNDHDIEDAKNRIFILVDKMGIQLNKQIRKSYLELLLEKK